MPDEPEPTTDDVGALRREAGSRRREPRAVEAEGDALWERVAGYERDAVTRLAADRLAHLANCCRPCRWTTCATSRAP